MSSFVPFYGLGICFLPCDGRRDDPSAYIGLSIVLTYVCGLTGFAPLLKPVFVRGIAVKEFCQS